MSKFLAYLFLTTCTFFVSLGNFWFTYGIWPKSWISFAGFWFLSLLIMMANFALKEEK